MNNYYHYSIRASLSELENVASDMGLFYSDDVGLTDCVDYIDDAHALAEYCDLHDIGRYVEYDFDAYLTFDAFDTFADRVYLMYCEDIDAYSTTWTYVYDECGDSFAVYDTYDYWYCNSCERYFTYAAFNTDYDACENCASEYYDGIIASYHAHKGSYKFFGDSDFTIGTEVECDGGGSWHDANECAEAVAEILGEHAFYEEDGSLSEGGFEIITHPHTVDEFFKLDWARVFNVIKSHGLRSHDAGNCGLHIHFSRAWFGNTETEQDDALIDLCNFYRVNYDTLFKLSRRSSTRWCANDCYEIDDDELYDKKGDNDHGKAINLGNWNRIGTLEFRLGRGTLNFDTFAAWIDLHIALVEQARAGVGSLEWSEWVNPDTVSARAWAYIEKKLGTPEKEQDDSDAATVLESALSDYHAFLESVSAMVDDLNTAGAIIAGV